MEDILQSIRKIIADDDTEGKPGAAKSNGAKAENGASDILELTEMIKEDGSVESLKPAAAAPAAPAGRRPDHDQSRSRTIPDLPPVEPDGL